MTEKQNEIYIGLKAIGPEIAQFYIDGIQLIESNLGTKSNLIAHILREIDGGLRDIFEQKQLKNDVQKQLKQEDLERVFNQFKKDYKNFDYLSDITFEDFKKERGHISSILVSFGFSFDHPLSAQYIKAVRWLSKYAHRSGSYNEPRKPKDIISLWYEFENVLSKLIGNFYALVDRIDSILQLEEPTNEVLRTLPNLLNADSRFIYFFNRLKSNKWLIYLENENYFDGSKNPEPVEVDGNKGFYSMPYWVVLTYLEEVAQQNLVNPNNEITESLLRIIENICQYRNNDKKRIENYHTDYSIFKIICTLPEEYLDDKYFTFIKVGLKSKWDGLIGYSFNLFLKRLITIGNKNLVMKGAELMLAYKVVKDDFEKVHSILKDYELETNLSEFKDDLIQILGLDLLDYGIQMITRLIAIDESVFNNIKIPAIEDHEQTPFKDDYECQLIYLVRDTLEKLDSNDIIEPLKGLLSNNDHPIFKRIAYNTIRVKYIDLQELFWSSKENPLKLVDTKHEVYELIKENSSKFSIEEIAQIVDWINSNDYYIPKEFRGENDDLTRFIAFHKKEWLSSMLNRKEKIITDFYYELNELNDSELEHPGFNSWRSSLVGNISPLAINDIVKLSIDEIIKFYTEFKSKDHDFMGPSTDGLIDNLTLAVRNYPNKYNKDCESLIDCPSQIRYAWIRGHCEGWREEKKNFECSNIFNVVLQITQNRSFWEAHNSDDNYCRWFVSSLLSFIEGVLQDDSHTLSQEELIMIKDILFNILKNDNYPVFDYSDLSMTILNNSKGKIYITLFGYSLRLARIERKDYNRWDGDIKKLLTEKIGLNDDNPLLFYVIGQFLPNIQYLDEDWMIHNFNKIFPLTSKTNWAASMNGYFFYNRRPNRIHFNLLMNGLHFKEALLNNNLSFDSNDSLVKQICIAYLNEFDSVKIESDVIQTLINANSKRIFSSLIYFFWSPLYPFEEKYIPKIKPFWLELYKRAIKMEYSELDSFILSGCCKWVNSVEEIDDELYEVLLHSSNFVNQRDRYNVITALAKRIIEYPDKIGNILIALFKKEISYDITSGKLQEMVEYLYDNGFKEIADKICLIHGESGYLFLRSVYVKNNL